MKRYIKRACCFGLAGIIVTCAAAPVLADTSDSGGSLSPAFAISGAEGVYQKDEIIYVNLRHDGQTDAIYVVNSFDVKTAGVIRDQGNYSEVINLTTTDPLSHNGKQVSVNAPSGKFYYEGVLKPQELPWDIAVKYRLDGKEVAGDALAGAAGRLSIDISFHQKDSANEAFRDHYTAQASLSLNNETCTIISAPDATIASVGNQKQLSYIILPGKDKELSITADVRDFEMSGISINMVPLSLAIDDPDTSEIKDKLYELQDGAVELDDGAAELDGGAKELDDGATKLDDGVVQLQDGVVELTDGAVELQDGADDLRDGANDLLDGAIKIKRGTNDLDDGASELSKGSKAFAAGLLQLNGQSITLTSASAQIRDALAQLVIASSSISTLSSDIDSLMLLETQAASVKTESDAYLESLDDAIAMYQAQLAALERSSHSANSGSDRPTGEKSTAPDAGGKGDASPDTPAETGGTPSAPTEEAPLPDSDSTAPAEDSTPDEAPAEEPIDSADLTDVQPAQFHYYYAAAPMQFEASQDVSGQAAVLRQTISTLENLRSQYLQVNQDVTALTQSASTQSLSLPQVAQALQQISQQYQQFDAGLNQYTQGVAQLTANFDALTDGIYALSDGVQKLRDGAEELRDGASELYDGTYDLQDGVRKLNDGTVELRDGVTELRDGTIELKDGTIELRDGTIELRDGTTELREKTADMDQEVDDKIDELLEEYRSSDFTPVSFVDPENTNVNAVQFVMKTAEISTEEAEETPLPPEPEIGPWKRFLNLFSFYRKE